MATEQLTDWAPIEFTLSVLAKHPAPIAPDRIDDATGEVIVGKAMWDRGIRLQGQQTRIMASRARFKQVGGGIRGGKSFVGGLAIYIDFLWRNSVRGVKSDLWGVIGDSYSMAQEEMRHLSRLLEQGGIPHDFRTPENAAWHITFPFCESEVVTLTASDLTKIASRPYRGLVVAEAAQTVLEAYKRAVERVSQTRGWVLLEGTFENAKGSWYHQLAYAWQKPDAEGVFFSLPTWENTLIYPGGRDDPEILARELRTPPAEFMERFGGEPAKRSDLAIEYADERYHVKHRFPYLKTSFDPEQPVYLFSDPGTAHAYSVLAVQMVPGGTRETPTLTDGMMIDPDLKWVRSVPVANIVWVIDTIYRWDRMATQIIQECAARPWAKNVELAVMDFAANQRRAEGAPIVEQWAKGWREAVGQHLGIVASPVPLSAGYSIHKRALLNSWPEEDAERMFNSDKRLRKLVDHDGPRLMFDPAAAAPLFGGDVDNRFYEGEYNLHRKRKNREGIVTSDDYIALNDDAIKALNYGLFWYFGPAGQKHLGYSGPQSQPFEVSIR